jgi:hypothetical protein
MPVDPRQFIDVQLPAALQRHPAELHRIGGRYLFHVPPEGSFLLDLDSVPPALYRHPIPTHLRPTVTMQMAMPDLQKIIDILNDPARGPSQAAGALVAAYFGGRIKISPPAAMMQALKLQQVIPLLGMS